MGDYDFDPELEPILELLPTEFADLGTIEGLAEVREGSVLTFRDQSAARTDVVTEDRTVPGLDDDPEVPVRIYTPEVATESLRPGLVYIHGGGFILGDLDMFDDACRRYSADLDAVIVSVDYRLAPENPYPAGLHDCYAVAVWFGASAGELGVDPGRIGVGGASAGGGLSAATALLARDRGGPALCFQYLGIPELDDRLDTMSMRTFVDTPLWNRPNAEISWRYYLGPLHGSEDVPYHAAPSRCEDLSGLPPAYISTMEFDPLRDEGIIYGLRMLQAGVAVELHSFPGTFHGSSLVDTATVSRREATETIEALRRGLHP